MENFSMSTYLHFKGNIIATIVKNKLDIPFLVPIGGNEDLIGR